MELEPELKSSNFNHVIASNLRESWKIQIVYVHIVTAFEESCKYLRTYINYNIVLKNLTWAQVYSWIQEWLVNKEPDCMDTLTDIDLHCPYVTDEKMLPLVG